MNCPLCHKKCELTPTCLRCGPADGAHYFYYGYKGDGQIVNAREVILIMPYRLTNYKEGLLDKNTYIDKWQSKDKEHYHSSFKDMITIPKISFENTSEEKLLNKIKTYLVFS